MPEGAASQPPSSPTPLSQPSSTRETPAWVNGIYAGVCLYFFLAAINVKDGSDAWLQKLPAEAVKGGAALDHRGRIYVSLENGQLLCYVPAKK